MTDDPIRGPRRVPPVTSGPTPPSVLIVDDDPFIRRLIVATLQDVTGFVLHQAGDGHEALAEAERSPPAIVFLDMQMPGLDGLATCRALRERAETRGTTIVMLTAAGPQAEAAAREAGADHFLTKPFSPLALLRLVDGLGPGDAADTAAGAARRARRRAAGL
jgi:two-component system chemotaxis response regulator CheY